MHTLQRYLKIVAGVDILVFFGVIIASAVTEKQVCQVKPIPIPFLSNDSDFQPQITIWDYRSELLEQAREHGPEVYHLLYISAWFIMVVYVVLEVWMYCVLTTGLSQKRVSSLKKWIFWRYLILTVAIAGCAYDLYRNQLTCTDAVVLPFSLFRILFSFFVFNFLNQVKKSSSTETIIMTGNTVSEKEKL